MLYIVISNIQFDEPNKSKFEKLYYNYRNVLFRYALKLITNRDDAEDVLQETFFKIAKNIKTIKDVNSKETNAYLIVMLRNTAYDFLRKKQKIIEIELESLDIIADDDVINALVNDIDYEKIVSVVKNIPSPYCEVLYLHYVRDLPLKQTAKLLNRKTETVKMQLVRGKKLLIKRLSEVSYE